MRKMIETPCHAVAQSADKLIGRRLVAFIAILAIFAGQTPVSTARSFPDTAGTMYETAFSYLSDRSIIQGFNDGLARPYDPLNRAQAVKVVVSSVPSALERADWYKGHMPPLSLFTDVPQAEWYAPFLEAGFERGIVTGYPDGTFRGGRLVTVEEGIALLLRAYGEQGSQTFQQSAFIQNFPGEWFTPFVNAAIQKNLIAPGQGQLLLGTPLTRGQFADMVYRMNVTREQGVVAFQDGLSRSVVPSRPPVVQQPTRRPIAQQPQQPAFRPLQGRGGNVASIGSTSGNENLPTTSAVGNPNASEKFFAVSIPKVGIQDLTITHPTDPFTDEGVLAPLQNGVGHLFSYPGGGGKIMVYGHSSGYPWDLSEYTKIFRKINELAVGDKIYVTYDGKLYVYEVTFEEAVPAEDTSRFNDNGTGEELILYTCWPPDSIEQRYLIHALPVETYVLR